MNHQQLIAICNLFKLGIALNEPKKVDGGLLHKMWRINTDEGSYAVKELSPSINLHNETIIKNYNLTETIASYFIEQGIPGVSAIKHQTQFLEVVHGIGFMVYPWVDARVLDNDITSEPHALKITNILAKMHQTHVDVPQLSEVAFDTHENDKITDAIKKSTQHHCPFAAKLAALQEDIIAINTTFHDTLPLLKQQTLVSHGDLDQKNVLWDKFQNPILIDWECVRKLNPTHEAVDVCLNWSGIHSQFDAQLFVKMMQAYIAAGGHINQHLLEAAFNAVQGNWINWMMYNIERSCSDEKEKQSLGIEQVNQVLKIITTLLNITPNLIKLF